MDTSRPINELTGIKKPSSVLVRGDSALTIAKQAGLVPNDMNEAQFVEYLRGPRGFSDFDYWLTLPGNAGKTPTDYFNFLGLAQAIATGLEIDQLAADVVQFNADAIALNNAAAALAAAAALDTSTLATKANPVFTGTVNISQKLELGGVVTPVTITADQNDYDPGNSSILRVSANAARTITGLAGGFGGRIEILVNVGGFPITLSNGNAGSIAANRFAFASDRVLGPSRAIFLIYDVTLNRWIDLVNYTKASAATIRAGTDDESFTTAAALNAAGNWVAAQAGEITTPAGVRTVTFSGANGFSRQDTLTANTTYAAPTGLVDGMTYQFIFIQDATGGRVHTMNAFFVAGSTPFAFTTAANAYNILTGTYHAGLNKLVGCSLWNSQ
jgi:hypothetical protein